MRTNVLNDLSNEVKKGTGLACSWSQVGRMSEGAPDEHPMSIRSASDGERWKPAGEKGSTRVWKHVAMIFAVLVMSMANVGTAWGATFVEKWQNGKNESTKDLIATFTLGTNASISSSRIQIENGNTGSFTWTIPTGYTITSVKFVMNSTDNRVASFTANNGTVTNTATKEWTYAPSASNINSATFSVKATGAAVQVSEVWVTFTDGVSDAAGDYESLYPVSADSSTPKNVTFTSSAATTSVTSITTENGVNNKCVQVANNKKVVITASKNIKYILFSWNKYAPSADSKWTANSGSYAKATYKWTPANMTTKSVTFTRGESNTAEISNIHIVYYASAAACGETAQAALTLSSNSGTICGTGTATFTVSGGSGTGELSVSSSDDTKATASIDGSTVTVTGVAAGSATITVTKACDATYAEKTATYSATVAAVPTANAGADKVTEPGEGVALAATAAADGCTGAWTIQSGPNTSTAQLSSTSSATATFTPTIAGTYTLRWTVTNTSSSCSAYDEMTVSAAVCSISECGNATLTYAINASTSVTNTAANLISSATASNTTAMGINSTAALSTITIGSSDNAGKAAAATSTCYPTKPTMSSKIGMYNGSSYNASNYLQFAFTVKTGYTFTPCDIQFTVQPVSNIGNFRWEVTDGTDVYGYGVATNVLKGSDGGASVLTGLTSTEEMEAGDYYIRLYPYYNGSNTFRISNNVILKGTTASAAPSCTAPNHVDITPTVEDGNYGWRYSLGETLKLTATAYSSAGTGSPITTGITGYQWQKYVDSDWSNLTDGTSDGVTISGATTANLQISNLKSSNGGSYRCTISTGATCSTSSGGYWVRVFTLNGNYSGSPFTENAITWTGEYTGTATVHLNAGQTYEFKIYDNDLRTFGNGGTITADVTGWGFGAGSGNCSLTTYYEGDYTFTITDFGHAADVSAYVTVAATYPERTIYMECGDWKNDGDKMAIYYWRGDKNGWSDFMSTFACDNNVRYVDIPSWAQYIIFGRFASSKTSTGNWDDKHNQSCNLTLGANDKFIFSGWTDCDGNSSFTNTTSFSPSTYTISFAGGTGSSGSMSSISSIACDEDKALTANSFTKTGYNFSCWHADVDVTVDDETVEAGEDIADQATIQNIRSNITLTAQWTAKTTTVTINANTANHGSTAPSSFTATYGSALPSFTAATGVAGYVLKGYYTDATGGTKVIDADGTFSANSGTWNRTDGATLTLYAQYEAGSYTVTLNNEDATTAGATSVSATYGSAMPSIAANKPAKTGYTFGGYYSAAVGGGTKYYNADGTSAKNSDFSAAGNLYALWTQTITIDDNGGSADGSASVTYKGTAGTPSVPTYSGHTVDLGYYAESGCTNKVMNLDGSLVASVTVSTVPWTNSSSKWIHAGASILYAHWKCNTPEISCSSNTVTITVPSGATVYYTTTTDGSTPSDPTSSSTAYNPSSKPTISADTKIKAIAIQSGCTNSSIASATLDYEAPATYSVTYAKPDGASGTPPTDATEYDSGDEVTVKANTDIAKDGTTFRGWTDGTTFYLVGQKFNITSNVTLTAVLDGGSSCTEYEVLLSNTTQESSTAPKGQYISGKGLIMRKADGSDKTDLTSTETPCHSSTKYFQTGSGIIAFRTYNAINKLTIYAIPSGDRTLSSITTGSATNSYGSDIKSTCSIKMNGSEWTGTEKWARDICGELEIEFPNTLAANTFICVTLSGNAYVYGALFENCAKSNFTVSFADGSTAPASHLTWPDDIEGVPTGKKILQPSTTPTASGYIFGGWYTNAACSSAFSFSGTITKDTTLYAKWTAKTQPTQYSVTGDTYYCPSGTATITLAGSQSGVSYQLLKGGSASGDPKAGTGSALNWTVNAAGTYTVKAVENATYAERAMSGSATVSAAATTAISTQPTTAVAAGASEDFTVGSGMVVAGTNLTYRWLTCKSDGTDTTFVTGATSSTYTTSKSKGTYYYRVRVSGSCGDPVLSNVITVTVTASHSVSAVTSTGTNTYGTVAAASASVTEGATTTITASPATGYQVTNWAVSGTGASISPSGASNSNTTTLTMGTADATVTVTFGAKTYSVTLDRGIGSSGSSSVTMTYNSSSHSAITAPTAPTGYTFAGWYTGEGGTGSMVMNASGTLQASVDGYTDGSGNWTKNATCTLYAKYTANYPSGYLYITDVMATPETGATASATDASYDADLDGSFSHSGLAHWAKASAKSSGVYTLTFASPITAGATAAGVAVDVWWGVDNTSNASTYIYLNGTSDSDEIGHYKSSGESQRKTLLEQLKNVQKVGTTSVSSLQLKCNDNPGSTWFRVGIKEIPGYLLTYDANEGSGAPSASYQPNATITLSSTVPTRTGYRFLGWNTEEGGGGTRYASGASFSMPAAATTLYAEWQEAATLEWLPNVNTAESSIGTNSKTSTNTTRIPTSNMSNIGNYGSLTITSNAKANLTSKIQAPASYDAGKYMYVTFTVPSGYEFVPSSVAVKFQPVDAAGDVKLELIDASAHSISKTQSSVASGSISTVTMTNGSSVAFKGTVTLKIYCYGASTGTYRLGSPIAITGDINELEGYTVTYADGGATSGSVPVDASSPYAEGADVTVLGNTGSLAKNGYTFAGWSDGVNTYSAGDVIDDISDDITLTAVWTPNDYTITYHLNGASWASAYDAPDEYTVGTGATLPISSNMTNTGYTFAGWKNNSSLTGDTYTSVSTSDYGNKEFWAKWTENTYDVTYNANGGSGTTAAQNGHYVTLRDNGFTAPSGKTFVEWNTATDGSGASYNEGEEVELTADLALYAIWANDYTITWGDVQLGGSGDAVTPNLGGGNYTITASVADWTGTLASSMISTLTDGVTITNVAVDNSSSPKTITATFGVGASVEGTSITLVLNVPAAGSYGTKSSSKEITIDRCTGSSSGSDGVLFSAEFKDSGLGTSNICAAANTPYTFTTTELKSAPTGGSIKAYTTDNLGHMKFATNAISIAGSNGVIQIDLDNAIQTYDLFTYVNVNSSSSSAYLRHTSADNTTDQIALTVYNSKEVKVMLPAGYNGKTTLYLVRNSNNFNLHKAAVVRPAFLMLLRDDTPTSDTNLEGTDAELTTGNYLTTIQGGRAYYTSPSSGNLKIKRSSSKNYINFNNAAGYVKIVLNDALQEGDVIGFDSYNTNNLALTTTATRSTSIVTTNQLYTVDGSSALKGATTFYIWQNSGSSDYLRGLQIARSGVAGGGGGSDQIAPTLTWDDGGLDIASDGVAKETGDADFTYTVTQDKNSLGAITYSSSNTSVATVNATTGKVHIVGAGSATITATIAESGCYEEATATYNITVTDNCDDEPGTISTEDLGCDGIRMTVTGHTTSGETVSYQWYKDGDAVTDSTRSSFIAKSAGEYYVVVTNTGEGHCPMASANTITVEAQTAATATKLVDQWYVKNGRRTPDIALVQTENADNFIVKSGSTPIWNSDGTVTTGFAGCSFYLGENGIIYLKGQKDDETEPSGLTAGDETLKFTAKACGGDASELSITIHKQAETTRPSVAFVVDGTKEGSFDAENEDHSVNTELYQFLDYGADETGAFDLTGQNVYSTVDEKAIREHYSQFDAILITDDPSTDTKIGKKSCVDAFGTMIDIRPILTMEAFVAKWSNWKAKGIDGNPESPNPRQYAMKLDCKNHAIFTGINSSSSNVEVETIDGVEYWTVAMVDNTKSPYDKHADNDSTSQYPALQGFEASDVSDLMLLGEISEGTLYAGVERQEEPAARLLLLGLNNKALPNALTPEGKKIIENALSYLIETDMEHVDDCSNYFTGAIDTDWNEERNWSKGLVPNSPYVKARILSPCVVSSGTFKVAEIDIATGGKSYYKSGEEINGSLTLNAGAALIIGGRVRSAKAPYFNTGDLMPTTVNDLIINTSSTSQAALVFNNDKGDTKATVKLYSKGRKEDGAYQFQYLAVPMNYIDVNPAFAGSGIYTYVWKEPLNNWERRAYYDGLEAFEGVGITTKFEGAKTYTLQGALTSTVEKDITLTKETSGQNIIGNSWLAPINIASLRTALVDDASIVDKTVYIYCTGNDTTSGGSVGSQSTETAGQWLAIPIDASGWPGWGGLKVIPAMQAFCIKANTGTTLTLNYKDHVRSTAEAKLTEKLRAPKRRSAAETEDIDLIRIRVADSKTHTDLYLFEGEQFSDEFDNGWEARYMSSDGRSAKLYAETTVGQMAVAAQPEYEGTVLGFAPGKETEYTFTFSGPNKDYYLNDLKLKKSTLISEDESYFFTFEEGDTNRFYISKTRIDAPAITTGTENTGDGVKARKVIVNDKLYILLNGKVYSAEGMIVK